mmetsp:Transcript_39201/g.122644  ORF Transcript_39201/g.122644 Transcript_39201/m.122644 type:complete len:254 (-) Transcript_39201:1519-2280(-)
MAQRLCARGRGGGRGGAARAARGHHPMRGTGRGTGLGGAGRGGGGGAHGRRLSGAHLRHAGARRLPSEGAARGDRLELGSLRLAPGCVRRRRRRGRGARGAAHPQRHAAAARGPLRARRGAARRRLRHRRCRHRWPRGQDRGCCRPAIASAGHVRPHERGRRRRRGRRRWLGGSQPRARTRARGDALGRGEDGRIPRARQRGGKHHRVTPQKARTMRQRVTLPCVGHLPPWVVRRASGCRGCTQAQAHDRSTG